MHDTIGARIVVASGLLACVLALLLTAVPAHAGPQAAEAAPPASVEVTAFSMPFRELDVASEIGGVLTAVHVEEGDDVTEGQALAEFKADVLQAGLAVGEARVKAAGVELASDESSYEILNSEYERALKLLEQKVMSEQQYNKARLDMELARWRVESAKAAQRVAELSVAFNRAQLEQTVVRAPITGRVFRVLKRAGEAVEVNGPVMKIVSVDPLYVIGYVPVATSGRIKVGMKAVATLENMADKPLEATVAVVDPVADAASGTYRVKLTLPNPDKTLTAGAKGTLGFVLPE
jgi:RND family efflux transporter MFP subunit